MSHLTLHAATPEEINNVRTTISKMAVRPPPLIVIVVVVVVVVVVLLQCVRRYQRQTRGYFSLCLFLFCKWLRVVLYTGHLVFSSCLIRKNNSNSSNEKRGQQPTTCGCFVVERVQHLLLQSSSCCCVPFSGGRLPFSILSNARHRLLIY